MMKPRAFHQGKGPHSHSSNSIKNRWCSSKIKLYSQMVLPNIFNFLWFALLQNINGIAIELADKVLQDTVEQFELEFPVKNIKDMKEASDGLCKYVEQFMSSCEGNFRTVRNCFFFQSRLSSYWGGFAYRSEGIWFGQIKQDPYRPRRTVSLICWSSNKGKFAWVISEDMKFWSYCYISFPRHTTLKYSAKKTLTYYLTYYYLAWKTRINYRS